MKKQMLKIINDINGRIFSVEFVKKDGQLRKMLCRTGVKKGITGKGLKFNPVNKGYLPVYDMEKKAYRMLNLDGIEKITFKGKTFNF